MGPYLDVLTYLGDIPGLVVDIDGAIPGLVVDIDGAIPGRVNIIGGHTRACS